MNKKDAKTYAKMENICKKYYEKPKEERVVIGEINLALITELKKNKELYAAITASWLAELKKRRE